MSPLRFYSHLYPEDRAGGGGWEEAAMLLFCWGRNESVWGLLANSWRPPPALAHCRRGRLPAAAAEQRLPLASASLLAPLTRAA